MKLTNLELCKKIAEIEGLNSVVVNGVLLTSKGFSCDIVYNPLTNKALLFDLMVKYQVIVHHDPSECFIVDENAGEYDSGVVSSCIFIDDSFIPRAILECIAGTRK